MPLGILYLPTCVGFGYSAFLLKVVQAFQQLLIIIYMDNNDELSFRLLKLVLTLI